jgi:uncharacterized membrane protein YqaE (UPF0057 family)
MCSADFFLGLLAILFPPLPVWVKSGLCSADSIINILLCLLGYIPGLLHAWYIIASTPDPYGEYEGLQAHDRAESGRVTYVFVQPGHQPPPQSGSSQPQNYGATAQQPHKAQRQQQQHQQQHQRQGAGSSSGGQGSSNGAQANPPPTYAEAVKGDNKVQTQE